jgi:chitin disaccharide deacetylase
MNLRRVLIVNADDFGQSDGVNKGIIAAHERGIVTSASLMVRWRAAAKAANYAKSHPEFSVGLHVDLGEWVYRNDTWLQLYTVVPVEDGQAVRQEVTRQVSKFRSLMGTDPTHIDSHQHVHRLEPVRSVISDLADRLGTPVRHFSRAIWHCGDFYGQLGDGTPFPEGIGVDNLIRILHGLSPGITELACHPGSEIDTDLETQYLSERSCEVRTLCDPRVKATLLHEGILSCSYHDKLSDTWSCP